MCLCCVIENQRVYESNYFYFLLDYEPRVNGHLLVIPKRHVSKAHELSKEEWGDLSTLIPKAVSVFSKFLLTDQYIILEKNGPNANQVVPHVHFHLLPVTTQKWADIFEKVPRQLNKTELAEEVKLFRSYFLSES